MAEHNCRIQQPVAEKELMSSSGRLAEGVDECQADGAEGSARGCRELDVDRRGRPCGVDHGDGQLHLTMVAGMALTAGEVVHR